MKKYINLWNVSKIYETYIVNYDPQNKFLVTLVALHRSMISVVHNVE